MGQLFQIPQRLYHTHQDNMFAKFALLALLATAATADRRPQQSYQQPSRPSYQSEEKQEGMPFNYNWEVNDAYSGNTFNHGSESDGKVTTGESRVLLPDGR